MINPVNDPPEFAVFDTTALKYQPGEEALPVNETIEIFDIDNDNLIMAEIGFLPENYSPANDLLVMPDGATHLRSVVDANGILFLIGHGSLEDYENALKSIRYYYQLTEDFAGNTEEILSGPRTIYMKIFDGQLASMPYQRLVVMQVEIMLDIPNAFTPNGDLSNDTWNVVITNSDKVENAIIRVYDRRGSIIYETVGFEKPWDGISNGRVLPVDTYYYTIDLNLSYMKKTYKGFVSILH